MSNDNNTQQNDLYNLIADMCVQINRKQLYRCTYHRDELTVKPLTLQTGNRIYQSCTLHRMMAEQFDFMSYVTVVNDDIVLKFHNITLKADV